MNMSKEKCNKNVPKATQIINYPRKVDWDLARDNMHFGKYGHEQLAKLFVGKVVPKKKTQCLYVNFQAVPKGNLYLSLFNHPPKEKLIPCISSIIPSALVNFE